ncbi:hypothetical protein [Paenibacillus sp. HB172176]|uniref:hypothetical protein n=1 Tax=Paenibacillus sp. HB172176 TaxID=2493690 RepID=UPI00143910AF|nr:hypothetical protein [Paenibacillus sp. HB172176]
MFELELQELLPYLLSISLFCTVAYAYASHFNTTVQTNWEQEPAAVIIAVLHPQWIIMSTVIQRWLVRHVKRKESPDSDETDCKASFAHRITNKRGGSLCLTIVQSHLRPIHVKPEKIV